MALFALAATGATTTGIGAADSLDRSAVIQWRDASALRLPRSVGAGNASSMDVEPADIDGDGDLDLVVAVEFGPNRLLANDGEGHFTDVTTGRLPSPARDSEDIGLADLNGDGRLDLVFASEDDRFDELYFGDGQGAFTDQSSRLAQTSSGPSAARSSNAVLVLDVDGDSQPDLLFGNAGPNSLYRNTGDGAFERDDARIAPLSRTTQDLEAGDIDGDGDLDLVEANEDGNRILIRQADGRYEDQTAQRLPQPPAGEETREADLADVDGDGDLDLYLANVDFQAARPPGDRLLLNDGAGRFSDVSATRLPGLLLHTVDVDAVDLDADGDLDLALAHAFGGGLRLLENDGTGAFVDATRRWISLPTRAFATDGIDVEAFALSGGEPPVLGLYVSAFRSGDLLLEGGVGAPVTQTPARPTAASTPTASASGTPPITLTATPAASATAATPPTMTPPPNPLASLYLPRLMR